MPAVVGDDFHGEVGFAIGCAAADWSAYAGGVFWVDPIHIEGNVIAGGTVSSDADCGFHYVAHTPLINVTHGEDVDAGTADVFSFDGVNVANAYQHTVVGAHFG